LFGREVTLLPPTSLKEEGKTLSEVSTKKLGFRGTRGGGNSQQAALAVKGNWRKESQRVEGLKFVVGAGKK